MKRVISMTGLAALGLFALLTQVSSACAYRAGASGQGDSGHALAHAATAAAAPAAQQTSQNEWRWRGQLASGRLLEVKGVNGRIEAEPSSSGEVEVVAVKQARKSNPDDVRIEVVEHSEGVTICAVYPRPDGESPNTCQPGTGGRMSVRNNDTTVNFRVRVPAGVRFGGHTVNGEVRAENLGADVSVSTVNGSVSVSTSGLARAKTVNGSIRASMGRADWSDELDFETVNGGIELKLPSSLSADVTAETLNGDITTDFPLTVTGRFSKRRLDATIGSGGRDLRLKTVNGSVQILRAS